MNNLQQYHHRNVKVPSFQLLLSSGPRQIYTMDTWLVGMLMVDGDSSGLISSVNDDGNDNLKQHKTEEASNNGCCC